jgi:cyanophycinase
MAQKEQDPMLALVGSGEYLPPIEAVDRELASRLPGAARVVCLPTAAGTEGAERIRYWMELGVEHFTRLGCEVHSLPVIDRPSANDPVLAETISQANFIYLSGGRPDYLYNALKDSLAWEAIRAVLANGGLLAGCSAGAMVLAEKFFGFPGWKAGFNLLSGATVIPHFDEIPEFMLKSMRLLVRGRLVVVGVEANTALLVDDGHYEVLGSGGVTVWSRNGKARYTQDGVPLLQLD